MSDDLSSSLPNIRTLAVDYARSQAEITLLDGRSIVFPMQHRDVSPILRSELNIQEQSLVLNIRDIGEIGVDTFITTSDFESRTIVYLDQLHWISLARAMTGSSMPDQERHAALALIRLVEGGKVILPLSGAHATEMAKAGGKWRRDLAAVMLRYSRGWQMLSPLSIRAAELRQMFAAKTEGGALVFPTRREVFTLEPRAIWADAPAGGWMPPSDLPPAVQNALRRTTWIQALFAALAEGAPSENERGRSGAQRWAESHHELALHMKDNPRAQLHKRSLTRIPFMTDMQLDLANAAAKSGMTAERFNMWLQDDAERDLAALPYLGRMREVIHHRLANSQDKWEANDLNDLLFLSCAAGYADIVVSEKKFGGYLRRVSPQFDLPAPVVANLSSAIKLEVLAGLTEDHGDVQRPPPLTA